ncbi:hypothetical protein TPA0905_75840 [Streptomyces olivaceus]|nr:hypothetical protein TPA0905_75840 [Streptomyces olivaceus]
MGAPLDPALRAGCRERRRRAAAPATAARPSPAGAGPRARRAAGPAALARPSPTATPELPGGRGGGVPPPRPGGQYQMARLQRTNQYRLPPRRR